MPNPDGDDDVKPLTQEEIAVLREIVKGRQSVEWLTARMKSVSLWISACLVAWYMFSDAVGKWLARLGGSH